MFRTSYDSRGKPQVSYDAEFAGNSAALQRARGDLRAAQSQLEQVRNEWKKGDDWRRAALAELAYVAQDEHADAVAFKAGLEFLMSDRDASAEKVLEVIEATKKSAARDRALLDKSVTIQNSLRRRFL
ncbi:hypothetical protein [Acidiphilium acidophilum]|uniref:Uncharacterized protein n=1 Tax=Acidiphilium acidophilum TaxID=76588 RepID=A0AAW9DST2_ACIAO|nr:hypothetical protein [Acidiphilium acidophilum]MDX5931748.1 hypothetical protein [Acidiphilium acidophilum]GBR75268.1 hypothetical protein AA700_0442 [Acidiphilium acidophilum DSM 700]